MTHQIQYLQQQMIHCCWECSANARYVGSVMLTRHFVRSAVYMVIPYASALNTFKAMPFAVDAWELSLPTMHLFRMLPSAVNGNLLLLPKWHLGKTELVMPSGHQPRLALPSEEQLLQLPEQPLL
jgi:hypothetical protein